jgi:hypothetical protein
VPGQEPLAEPFAPVNQIFSNKKAALASDSQSVASFWPPGIIKSSGRSCKAVIKLKTTGYGGAKSPKGREAEIQKCRGFVSLALFRIGLYR